jgi:hypothetical protein
MYRRTVSAETAPTVATKNDRDHNVGSRDRRCENSARSACDVKPFNWFAMYDGECFG